MELLGHSDIRLTANVYTHVEDATTAWAAKQINEALWPSTGCSG